MKEIKTTNAPEAIGPYSQGIILNKVVYTSGQLPIDPATKVVVDGIANQTIQVFKNAEAILKEAGSSLDNVVKTTVYLKDLSDFAEMNEEYAKFFTGVKPARSTIGGAQIALGALVEIEFIAYID